MLKKITLPCKIWISSKNNLDEIIFCDFHVFFYSICLGNINKFFCNCAYIICMNKYHCLFHHTMHDLALYKQICNLNKPPYKNAIAFFVLSSQAEQSDEICKYCLCELPIILINPSKTFLWWRHHPILIWISYGFPYIM